MALLFSHTESFLIIWILSASQAAQEKYGNHYPYPFHFDRLPKSFTASLGLILPGNDTHLHFSQAKWIDKGLIVGMLEDCRQMARNRGNPQQEEALEKLLSALIAVRNFTGVRDKYRTVRTPTELLIKLDLTDFPIIRIGGRGGFEMPDIHTHPGASPPDSLKPPPDGRTAFDACLFGDKYVARQGSGAANSSPLNNLQWESD